jgi:hypothetical protein
VSRRLLDFTPGADAGGGDGFGIAGFVRLEVRERNAWYWTYLVGVPGVDGVLVVRDHEVLPPKQGLEIRADGLWAELTCETPREHWTFGLEAFGVRLDHADEALRAGGEIGERIAVGLDIEWEVGADGPPAGNVHGDVLVGRARHEIDGPGWFYDDGVPEPDHIGGDVVANVYVPIERGYIERRLVRVDGALRWTTFTSGDHDGYSGDATGLRR